MDQWTTELDYSMDDFGIIRIRTVKSKIHLISLWRKNFVHVLILIFYFTKNEFSYMRIFSGQLHFLASYSLWC